MKLNVSALIFALIPFASTAAPDFHFQNDFTVEEFQERRSAVYAAIGENIAIIQGAEDVDGFVVFRQSNTFFYLSGLETPSAYMVLDGVKKETTIYLPHRDPERERVEGKRFSAEDHALIMKITGVERVRPIEKMGTDFTHAYLWRPPTPALYTPFSPDEKERQSRDEVLSGQGRRIADPWDGRASRPGQFIQLLRLRYPQFEIRDLSLILDNMRLIKSGKEIDLIRRASELAGLGIAEAIRSTRAGVMEYQLEAVAQFIFKMNDARGFSYSAIVGGGTNAWMGHYSANSDPVADGDLILMDVAPDYHYYTSDVTRMWPVNGRYTPDQRDLYGFIVEYQKALLRYIRPGVTPDQVMAEAASDMRIVFSKIKFSKEIYRTACEAAFDFKGHLSHPVGMTVHDVGNYRNRILEPGMVFSIDPMIWVPEETLYVRMEDVVVVTDTGVENLSDNLAVEMDDIERLMEEVGVIQKLP
ncbi:MAG: aminopeptidase P N-terminal domain-containing protein [Proteobacteria bacterium]|nr:aminopeptidase P N-terminal domain-containing protein [Pseudomonadota bacterium]MDA0992050.1 aminopeptidase P N-terminal domain-containing protein [Pseudomonadota bacterium]